MFRLNRLFIGLFGLAFAAIAVDNAVHGQTLAGIVLPGVAALWLLTLSVVRPRHHRMHGFHACRRDVSETQPAA